MKANETKVEDFLSTPRTQFVIPVYQRNYDWTKPQCKQLFDDILISGLQKDIQSHFIGSIVHIHDDVYSSNRMKELTIIDGQQRLTTITLIYFTLVDFAKSIGRDELAEEIKETYLINKFASEDDKLKLKLTDNNDKAFKSLFINSENIPYEDYSNLIENFIFFKTSINQDNYEIILNGLSKLMFVEVALERNKDDPQRIFESLNSTGLELSQADLIRNYILMYLDRKDQNLIYQNYWKFIENYAIDNLTNTSKVSEFIRDYLTLESKKIPNKDKVYLEFKNKFQNLSIEEWKAVLSNIKNFVIHYNKLINPRNEKDQDIQKHLDYIKRLEINVAYPFLMKVYDDFSKDVIDKKIFILILELVQSYAWRRFIIGLPTNALNKIFMNLHDKINPNDYLLSIQRTLLSKIGSQRFPTNAEVRAALKIKDVYNIKSKNRTYLLERLENFNNNEPVVIDGNECITIEHIFPQNPDKVWKQELGSSDYDFIKNNLLNTVANLTLSGNNGKLGNRSFVEKRNLEEFGYKSSRLWLNKYLSELDRWDKQSIEARYELMANRFIQIWQVPEINIKQDNIQFDEVSIFDADDPTGKKLEYAIYQGRKISVRNFIDIYFQVMKSLFELNPSLFANSELASRINLTKYSNVDRLRQALKLNEEYYIEGNFSNKSKHESIKLALTIFDLEDDLLIKFSD